MKALTLRTKLVCTLALIVCIVAFPIAYFAYSDTLARSLEAAEGRFD